MLSTYYLRGFQDSLTDPGKQDYQRKPAWRREEDIRGLTVPTAPLHHDHLSLGLANDKSVPAPDTENQQTDQQTQEEAPQQKVMHLCPYCSTMFARHHNLKSHLLTHSDVKPFLCQKCNMEFGRFHDLKRHARLHTAKSLYTCHGCHRTYARLEALVRHLKTSDACASQNSIINSGVGSEVGLTGDENMKVLEPNGFIEPEYAGFQDDGPTDASRGNIIDRSHSESLALGTASLLDAERNIPYHGSCAQCHHYHNTRVRIPAVNEEPTIVKCDSCAFPMVTIGSKSPYVSAHLGP